MSRTRRFLAATAALGVIALAYSVFAVAYWPEPFVLSTMRATWTARVETRVTRYPVTITPTTTPTLAPWQLTARARVRPTRTPTFTPTPDWKDGNDL